MTCDAMRERILEADLVELRGEADTPLAQHIQECDHCRALARKIVESEAALGAALDSITSGIRTRTEAPGRRRRWHWAALVPLAAAAGLAAIMLRGGTEAPPVPALPPSMQVVNAPVVETSGDQNVAVFTTDDPDIVVVWFLGGTD